MTIVEPGGARTEFRYGSAQVAAPMPEYDGNPAHAFMRMRDPGKTRPRRPGPDGRAHHRERLMSSLRPSDRPGSQAPDSTIATLRKRIEGFKAQRDTAASTDYPQGA